MIRLQQIRRGSHLLAAGLLALTSSHVTRAGSPRFLIEYTNMTPDALSDEASKQCSNRLKSRLGNALDTANEVVDRKGENVIYINEAERRERVRANGSGTADFMSWGKKEVSLDDGLFAVVVDCRPEKRLLDVLLVGRKGGITLRLRGMPLSNQRLDWLVNDMVTRIEAMYWR